MCYTFITLRQHFVVPLSDVHEHLWWCEAPQYPFITLKMTFPQGYVDFFTFEMRKIWGIPVVNPKVHMHIGFEGSREWIMNINVILNDVANLIKI